MLPGHGLTAAQGYPDLSLANGSTLWTATGCPACRSAPGRGLGVAAAWVAGALLLGGPLLRLRDV